MTDTDRRIQVSVTLPEPLYLQWRKRVDGLNLSRMLEEALKERLRGQ
jgi:post-segregation antitoxin (ccd killing protein)